MAGNCRDAIPANGVTTMSELPTNIPSDWPETLFWVVPTMMLLKPWTWRSLLSSRSGPSSSDQHSVSSQLSQPHPEKAS
jgi:hypothetical protein